jgi:hypothetical protein
LQRCKPEYALAIPPQNTPHHPVAQSAHAVIEHNGMCHGQKVVDSIID